MPARPGSALPSRFLAQAEATFTRLAGMPGMGASYEHDHPALAGLRFFPVSRFHKYLVFYRSIAGGIEIVRVLHGGATSPASWRRNSALMPVPAMMKRMIPKGDAGPSTSDIRAAMATGRYVYEDEVVMTALYLLLQDMAGRAAAGAR